MQVFWIRVTEERQSKFLSLGSVAKLTNGFLFLDIVECKWVGFYIGINMKAKFTHNYIDCVIVSQGLQLHNHILDRESN